MVCDEITSALDVSVQALLVEQLRQLQVDRGLSMVSSPTTSRWCAASPRMVVLSDGVIVEHGPVDRSRPSRPRDTQRLLADLRPPSSVRPWQRGCPVSGEGSPSVRPTTPV
jgi:peptide/nickel transport system ATP-binding protein